MTTRALLYVSVALLGCQRTLPRDAMGSPSADVGNGDVSKEPGPTDAALLHDSIVTVTSAEPPAEAPPPPPKRDPRCPSKMLAAEGTQCTGDVADCDYVEGSCTCAQPPACTGIVQAPKAPGPGKWRCNPTDPKAVRADGCPFLLVAGIPCKQAGRVCTYPTCPWRRESATCDGKKWIPKFEQLGAPPP